MNRLDSDNGQIKAIGKRFQQFRNVIGKSTPRLEKEAKKLGIKEARIKLIEKGIIIPNIVFIQYFTEEYGLNLTWLVTGDGNMFYKKGEKTPGKAFHKENPEISMLINSAHYFLDLVLIKKENNKYRLVVLDQGRVLYDKPYTTLKSCKIAFQIKFKEKARNDTKARWSHFYYVYKDWWEDMYLCRVNEKHQETFAENRK